MEEAESDHNIPDTFFGIECPPYEDPPPPYSSPKPPPRILPREAPPPYEEVDHTRNSPPAVVVREGGRTSDRSNNNNNNNNNNNRLQSQGAVLERERNNHIAVCRQSVMNEICQLIRDQHQTGNARSSAFPSQQEHPQSHSPESNTVVTPSRQASDSTDSSQNTHKVTQNECLGNVCESSETLHGCNCQTEQTLLKKSFSPVNLNDQQGLRRQSGQTTVNHNHSAVCGCTQSPSDGEKQTQVSSCSAGSENRDYSCKPISSVHKYSTLPSSSKNISVDPRSDCMPNAGENERMPTNTKYPTFPKPQSGRSDNYDDHSQSCSQPVSGVSRMVSEERMSPSLPQSLPVSGDGPLACDRPPAGVERGPGTEQSQDVQQLTDNEHQTLRNARLLSLWSSPDPRPESPGSPGSTLEKNIIRSHSVNSEISLISVCSETGEKRASRNAARVLESDSQYPDIPVSAHALKLSLQSDRGQHLERETAQKSVLHNCSDTKNCKTTAELNNHHNSTGLNPSELNWGHNDGSTKEEKVQKSKLNAINENSFEMINYVKPDKSCAANEVAQLQNKQTDPLKHCTRTKKSGKKTRHSTGSAPVQKPKRPQSASVSQDSTNMLDAVADATALSCERNCAIQAKPAIDPARKKSSKSVSDSFKQYGFIDDPSHFQSSPACTTYQQVHFARSTPRDGKHITKDTESPLATGKLGVKRHLTNADKSSYSPSPTRHKTSRPRSMGHVAAKSENPATENQNHLSTSQNIPRRKAQSSCRSKKRQSYPACQNVHRGADVTSTVVTTPHPVLTDKIANKADTISSSLSNGAVVQTLAKQSVELGGDRPVGLITVRNGPLSSYV